MLTQPLRKPAFWVLLALIAVYLSVHLTASYSFPIPWPDESFFLWQAISVQEANSLLAPELNPDRPILWMPPGYVLVAGTTFKLLGFSFDLARGLSLLFVVASFVTLILIIQRYGRATPAVLFCGLGLLSGPFIAAGNVARMEALLLLIIGSSFLLLQHGQVYKSLALLSLSPLVHPNGLYFVAAAIAYLLLGGRLRPRWPAFSRVDVAIIVVALVCWSAYGLYAGLHWPDLVHDITFQLQRKGMRDVVGALFTERNLLFLLLFAFGLAYTARERLPVIFLLSLAAPAWIVNQVGKEMWYQVFDVLAYLLLSIVLMHVILHMAATATLPKRCAAGAGTLVLLIALGLAGGWIVNPIGFPRNVSWVGMRPARDVPYVEEGDIAKVRLFFASLPQRDGPTWVQFYPHADALFFQDLDGERIRFSHPLFYTRKPDVYIIHLSRHTPPWLSGRVDQAFQEAGLDPTDETAILYRRDDTEVWYSSSRQAP